MEIKKKRQERQERQAICLRKQYSLHMKGRQWRWNQVAKQPQKKLSLASTGDFTNKDKQVSLFDQLQLSKGLFAWWTSLTKSINFQISIENKIYRQHFYTVNHHDHHNHLLGWVPLFFDEQLLFICTFCKFTWFYLTSGFEYKNESSFAFWREWLNFLNVNFRFRLRRRKRRRREIF